MALVTSPTETTGLPAMAAAAGSTRRAKPPVIATCSAPRTCACAAGAAAGAALTEAKCAAKRSAIPALVVTRGPSPAARNAATVAGGPWGRSRAVMAGEGVSLSCSQRARPTATPGAAAAAAARRWCARARAAPASAEGRPGGGAAATAARASPTSAWAAAAGAAAATRAAAASAARHRANEEYAALQCGHHTISSSS